MLWDFDDPSTGTRNESTDTMPSHIYSSPGIYNPRLIIYYNTRLTDTLTQTIEIVTGVKPQLGPDRQVCDSQSVTLSLPPTFSAIRWSTGPSDTLRTLKVTSTGNYRVVARGPNQCSARDTINIFFNRTNLILPKDTAFCLGDSVMLDAGNPGYTFNLEPGRYRTENQDQTK